MSSRPATMYLPSIAAHSQLVPSVQVTATNDDFDDLYDATEEEIELPTAYDFDAPIQANGYVPLTNVSAFVASLKAPTKKSLKALNAVAGNAAEACLPWQDEYLKLESQLRKVDEEFTKKSDPRNLMGFNANGVDLFEEWKEKTTPKWGFHEDPGYTVPKVTKKREPRAKPAAKPTTTNDGTKALRPTDNLAIDTKETPAEGGRGQRTRKPPKRFGDDVGPKGPEKTRATSEPKAAEEPTKKRKRKVEEPAAATSPPPAKRPTRAMSVVKKEPTPSPPPSPPPPPPPPIVAPAIEKKRKRAEEDPAPTLPPAPLGRSTRSASAAATAPAKPSTQATSQANKRVKLTQQFLAVLPAALPAAPTSSAAPPPPTPALPPPPPPAPKKRGRPAKSSATLEPKIAKKRGRPRKIRSPKPDATTNEGGQTVDPVRSSAMAGVWARRIAAGTNGRNGGAPKPKTVKKRGQLAKKMMEEEEEEEKAREETPVEEAEDEEMGDEEGGSSDDDEEEGQAGQMAVEV